jgi:hypothetical protein
LDYPSLPIIGSIAKANTASAWNTPLGALYH